MQAADYDTIPLHGAKLLITTVRPEELSAPFLTSDDLEYLAGKTSTARRSQTAAWRAAVRMEIGGGRITYDNVGAPRIEGSSLHIGVSHTSDTAAVIIADSKCAVDIEKAGRNFDRASSKYISEDEAALPEAADPLFKGLVWCAKETMYKYSGLRELDFLRNLAITATDIAAGTLRGEIRSESDQPVECRMHIIIKEGNIIVYTIGGE